uniref:Aquaporin n=1 Tax=Parastrongyloides trichosuri TaxID=131310 RepID=A0A0N4Z360_PARTI
MEEQNRRMNFSYIKEPIIQLFGCAILSFLNSILLNSTLKFSNFQGHALVYVGLIFIFIRCFSFKNNCCFNPNITIAYLITLKKKFPICLFILFMQLFGNFIGITLAYLLSEDNINDKLGGKQYNEFFSPYLIDGKSSRTVLLWLETISIFIIVLTALTNERGKALNVALSQFIISYISFVLYLNNNLGNIFMHLNTAIIISLFSQIQNPFNIFYIHSCASLIGIISASIIYYILQWNKSNSRSDENSNNEREMRIGCRRDKVFDVENNLNHETLKA